MLCPDAKTRQLVCGCSGVLRTPISQVCSAGEYQSVCLRNFDQIRREDDNTCLDPYSRKYYRLAEAGSASKNPRASWSCQRVQNLVSARGRIHRGMHPILIWYCSSGRLAKIKYFFFTFLFLCRIVRVLYFFVALPKCGNCFELVAKVGLQ